MQKHHLRRFSGLAKRQHLAHLFGDYRRGVRRHDTKAEERLFHFRDRVSARHSVDAGSCCTARQHRFFLFPFRDRQGDAGKAIRLGGLVKEGSVTINGLNSIFTVTDGGAEIEIHYANALPSLFREGQGVVAEGRLENGVLVATNVLAKHDETYMPKEIADSLKKQGVWQGGD